MSQATCTIRGQRREQIATFKPASGNTKPRTIRSKKCMRCGKTMHWSDQCHVLEKGMHCNNCGKKGHLSGVCLSKSQQNTKPIRAVQPAEEEVPCEHEVEAEANIHTEVTPRLTVTISHQNGKFRYDIFPDTGGVVSLISEDLIRKHDVPMIHPPMLPSLQAVNSQLLTIVGLAKLHVLNKSNNISELINAVISPDIENNILLGFHDLQELGVVSRTFPIAKFSSCGGDLETMKEKLCRNFEDVIWDTLPNIPMKGEPMQIELKEGAIPYKVLTTRRTPKHSEKAADLIVEQLIEKRIIARVNRPTPWTAPGFWVPKSDGKGICLIIDLLKLNKYIL